MHIAEAGMSPLLCGLSKRKVYFCIGWVMLNNKVVMNKETD